MPAFLLSLLGNKYVLAAAGAALVIIAYLVWLGEHDAKLRAEDAARVAAATAAEQVRQAQAGAAAVRQNAEDQIERMSRASAIKQDIAHAAPSNACATSPAIAAALAGLRGSGADSGQASPSSGTVVVPSATISSRRPPR